jgi:hypothetical protein
MVFMRKSLLVRPCRQVRGVLYRPHHRGSSDPLMTLVDDARELNAD